LLTCPLFSNAFKVFDFKLTKKEGRGEEREGRRRKENF
jgi:hypothetical protein